MFLHTRQSLDKRSHRLMYVGLAFVIGFLADFLFFSYSFGINFGIFVFVSLLAFILLSVFTKQIRQPLAFFLLIPITILTFDVLWYANDLVQHFVPFFVFFLMILFSVILTLDNIEKHPFKLFQIPIFKKAYLPVSKIREIYGDMTSWKKTSDQQLKKIFIGILIAVPFLLIFTALFANADAVFANAVNHFFDFSAPATWLVRVIRVLVFTLLIGGGFYTLLSHEHTLGARLEKTWRLDTVILSTIFGLINALFLSFVFIQIKYFFGGAAFVLDNGLTYADYARHGFFELVAVMILAGSMVLWAYRSLFEHGTSKFLQVLKILLLVQIAVVAISALRRMYLYQNEYGFTVLRLYVEWFIYFAILTLTVSGICLLARVSFHRFFAGAMMASLFAFTVIASLNVEHIIASENIARGMQGHSVDGDYLYALSTDAAPDILSARGVQLQFAGRKTPLVGEMHVYSPVPKGRTNWREYNHSIWIGKELLQK